jgi:hypothetical protein
MSKQDEKESKNHRQIRDFVEVHNLMNRHSLVYFEALVSITTIKHIIRNEKMEVGITFDDVFSMADLNLLVSHLNPHLYPTNFIAKYQNFMHINNEYLLIEDVHTRNPDIGKYEVKITPLNRLRD